MIRLNLIPPKVRAAELLRKLLAVGGAVYVLGFAWLGWQWSLNKVKVAAATRAVAKVQAELDAPELQVAVKAVQKFADDMAAVKAKASIVNDLRQQQISVVRLADMVPDWTMGGQVWIQSVNIDDGVGSRAVVLTGSTVSKSAFVRYYDYMSAQPALQKLSLNSGPTLAAVKGTPAVNFVLGFVVGDQP